MPDLLSFVVKETQGAHVAGYSEVSIVSAEFQRNLLVLVSQRHVAVLPAPVLERTYASSKAVSCSFPVDDPFSLPRFTPVVGKTKEIEALYVRFFRQVCRSLPTLSSLDGATVHTWQSV